DNHQKSRMPAVGRVPSPSRTDQLSKRVFLFRARSQISTTPPRFSWPSTATVLPSGEICARLNSGMRAKSPAGGADLDEATAIPKQDRRRTTFTLPEKQIRKRDPGQDICTGDPL